MGGFTAARLYKVPKKRRRATRLLGRAQLELGMQAMMDPYYLFLSIFLGLIAFGAFRYGRQNSSVRHLVIATILMVVPYFVVDPLQLGIAGGALTVFLFWP